MSIIRVMVVDDSAFMRKVITNLLQEKGTIEVIATAKNGKDAIELLKTVKPDVITLDIEMPIMNGLEFLEATRNQLSIPVLVLSSLTREVANETIRALELGAVDFITKPSGAISLDINKLQEEIVSKVEHAAKCDPKKLKRLVRNFKKKGVSQQPRAGSCDQVAMHANTKQYNHLVLIGTSTGGPKALQVVLSRIPADLSAPILIVQHMPPGFTKSLADRLNNICQIEVMEASHRQKIKAGRAYIAPGNFHMTVTVDHDGELAIHLDQEMQPRGGHRPSVDVLFESAAKISNLRKIAVIMTGMGSDGSQGLKRLKEKNNQCIAIAEHESTCVVYGMPKSAIQTGYVDHITPLEQIGEQIGALVSG